MICTVIRGSTFEAVYAQIQTSITIGTDSVELRLDTLRLDHDAIQRLRSHFKIPMIFTVKDQETFLSNALNSDPEYLDLSSPTSIPAIHKTHPHIQIILSYHDFDHTPENLDAIYDEMQKTEAAFYKIALKAHSAIDAMRLLYWAQKKADPKLIIVSMGIYGQISRILSATITYAYLDEPTALGQLSLESLVKQYRYKKIAGRKPDLYALIGNPVEQSISDHTHNAFFDAQDPYPVQLKHWNLGPAKASEFDLALEPKSNSSTGLGINAVYIKIPLEPSEIAAFLNYAKPLNFKGLSVTMPLKEAILPYLDAIDAQAAHIGAVNTIVFKNHQTIGYNTDGKGALNAIEKKMKVKNKHIVIMGAGGAARAIAYEALQRGARVTIVNRHTDKAQQLAAQLQCQWKQKEEITQGHEQNYEGFINCTPVAMPIPKESILNGTLIMDIGIGSDKGAFLQTALEKHCLVIHGKEMFEQQALGQFILWGIIK